MRAFVQTRGRARHVDYEFLGSGPEPWWLDYRGHTTFEQPTILVRSSRDGGWQVYLSGIPSVRRDIEGTTIRYTLALDGDASDAPLALSVVTSWLGDQQRTPGGDVGVALDDAFPETAVERLLAQRGEETREEAQRQVLVALAALPDPAVDSAPAGFSSWLGDLDHPGAQAAFLSRVASLLAGDETGQALVLNLVASADDVAALVDGRSLAVLAVDLPSPKAITALRRDGPAPGKEQAPPRTSVRVSAQRRVGPLGLVLLAVTLVLIVAVAVLGTLLWIV
jgi:hypothetical protein